MENNSFLEKMYAKMDSKQIINTLLYSKDKLSIDVLEIARAELNKRNVNYDAISLEKEKERFESANFELFKMEKSEVEINTLIKSIIKAKVEGRSNLEIKTALERKGIPPDIGFILFKTAKQKCVEKLEDTKSDIFYGAIITIVMILLSIAVNKYSGGQVVFVAVGLLAFGIIRLAKGLDSLSTTNKTKSIINDF